MKKKYWKGIEDLTPREESKDTDQHIAKKNSQNLSIDGNSRRDFLKLMGFSVAAVATASCEAPIRKAIPYLNKPETIDPGIPNYYASTYIHGSECCPVVVKTREGRPIFIEGNSMSSLTQGAVSPTVIASVLSLYDIEKEKFPTKNKEEIDWEQLDGEIKEELNKIVEKKGNIRILTHSLVSPSTKKVLEIFMEKFPNTKVVSYDIHSSSALLEAHKDIFDIDGLPNYRFEKAAVVVSFDADFLGRWNDGSIYYAPLFEETRKVGENKKNMSIHFQFESRLSLTGANADYRTPLHPNQYKGALLLLYNEIAKRIGEDTIPQPAHPLPNIEKAAEALVKARGESLVLCGSNDIETQKLTIAINKMLDNYGKTIDITTPYQNRQGKDKELKTFVKELNAGEIDAVLFYNTNPIQNSPFGKELIEGLKKVPLRISSAEKIDPTAKNCIYNCPDSHYLESWNDAEVRQGELSLCQPTISPIFNTRQFQESLLRWADHSIINYKDFIIKNWEENYFIKQNKTLDFLGFWQKSLHDGVTKIAKEKKEVSPQNLSHKEIINQLSSKTMGMNEENTLSAVFYFSSVMGDGLHANNPILQEIPDPISKVCWGHFVSISQKMYKKLDFHSFETTKIPIAKITLNKSSFELPVIAQPGQAQNTLSISFGYGDKTGKVAQQAQGVNVFPFLQENENGNISYHISDVEIENTGKNTTMAMTQTHDTIMGRETIIQETTLKEYQKDPKSGSFAPLITTYEGEKNPTDISLWNLGNDVEKKDNGLWNDFLSLKADTYTYPIHHWGMVIDLNSCIGCSACTVACNLENNVPVVGKQEVVNRREMHWLRIDRYYSSAGDGGYDELEKAAENPQVVFQPMMCQHCNNAPCETVCPVAATTHSTEGLNQMTYNRCVGTKYCANNCPYKVRRFNWFKYNNNEKFDYYMNNDLGKMVLNPDVTVRSRGVMEKCSMCVQRLQAGKLKAKMDKKPIKDGEVITACASSCPTNAITFGDLNDEKSKVRELLEKEVKERAYNVLHEINTRPNVWYLRKVRNT